MKISRLFALALSVIAAFLFLLPSAANAAPQIEAGVANAGPNPLGCRSNVKQFEIPFSVPFRLPPVVTITPKNNFDYPVEDTFAITIDDVYQGGVIAHAYRVNDTCWNQDLLVDWIAVEPLLY